MPPQDAKAAAKAGRPTRMLEIGLLAALVAFMLIDAAKAAEEMGLAGFGKVLRAW